MINASNLLNLYIFISNCNINYNALYFKKQFKNSYREFFSITIISIDINLYLNGLKSHLIRDC